MIFQSITASSVPSTMENHQIWHQFGKKMKKSLVLTCLKPICPWHFQNLKPGFRVPDPSLDIVNDLDQPAFEADLEEEVLDDRLSICCCFAFEVWLRGVLVDNA